METEKLSLTQSDQRPRRARGQQEAGWGLEPGRLFLKPPHPTFVKAVLRLTGSEI